MRIERRCAIVLIAIALWLAGPLATEALAASPHVALVETFTSATCAPCAGANPVTRVLMENYQQVIAVNVQYHMSWPAPGNDPMYLANISENDTRRAYYGINAIPDLVFDGKNTGIPGNLGSIDGKVRGQLALKSPVDIRLTTNEVGGQLTVDVEVTALEDLSASTKVVRIAIVEPVVTYGSPPGTNGETVFYATMRRMLPGAGGTVIAPAIQETVLVSETVTLDPAWNGVYAVVWVQDEASKQVLQSAISLEVPTAFFFGAGTTAGLGEWGQLETLETTIANYGTQSDTYDFAITKDLPATWDGSVCHEETCFAPFVTDFSVSLDPGQADRIYCDIAAYDDIAQGKITLTATSQTDPSRSFTKDFKLISPGIPILSMDNDGGYDYEQYSEAALADAGYTYATWDNALDGKLDEFELGRFRTLVWSVGLQYPALTPGDRLPLIQFLNGGGKLFIHGQDLGWDINSTSGSSSTTTNQAFYRNRLGATYVLDDTNDLTIEGVPGDVIFDGVNFSIGGGDGANNQTWPDEINAFGSGVACLRYSANREAAVRLESGESKVVYMGFGFEGISTASDRALVMDRVMQWFGPAATAVGDLPGADVARLVGQPQVMPNPFNPQTTIGFEVAGPPQVDVSVDVIDLRGRTVRHLFAGTMARGLAALPWDGRDASGSSVASGVYFARIRVGEQVARTKMVLVK